VPHVRIWPGGDGQPSSLPGPIRAMASSVGRTSPKLRIWLIGAGNNPSNLATSGTKGIREPNGVRQYSSAVAAVLDEKRDHIDHDQRRPTWIDGFKRMA